MSRLGRLVLPAILLLLAGCLLHAGRGYYLHFGARAHASGSDDASISYRYAWNLVHHGTLSWNESGYRRTEGFTNPAWVYASALAAAAGPKEFMYPAMAAASALLLALLLALHARVAARWTSAGAAAFAALLAAASPPLWVHATAGLESAVFGACLSLLALAVVTGSPMRRSGLALLAAAPVLLRSDGIAFVLPVAAAAFLVRHPERRRLLAAALLAFAALLLWRFAAFGPSLFPTTAAAKLNGSLAARADSGLRLLATVLFGKGFWIYLAAGGAGLLLQPLRTRLAAGLVALAWTGYYVFIGGDYFLERHLVALLLFAAMLGAPFWRRAFEPAARTSAVRRVALAMLAVLLPLALLQPVLTRDARFAYHRAKGPDPWVALGKAMHADRARYGTVVCAAAGKIPFFAGGDFVDPIGLNDEELARLPMPEFQPGHSSGSVAAAQAMLRRQGRAFTVFTFLPYPAGGGNTSLRGVDRRNVLLCVSLEQPDSVHTVMTDAFWRRVERGGTWCAIVYPDTPR